MTENSHPIQSTWASVQDHARQFADFTFVYPVISRRARGLSLGINLNPDKVCNFDCVYCEVDRRTPGKTSRVDLRQMREELVALIQFAKSGGLGREPKFNQVPWLTREIKDLSFSGDGEPTLVDNFAQCVQVAAEVKRTEHLDQTKIVLITDAAGLDKADVKRGLSLMDAHQGEVWAKLDAGTESYFQTINRTSVRFERILKNLRETARIRPIVIQSLFLRWQGEATPAAELVAYCDRLNELTAQGAQIKEVHAYTIARPTPEISATALSAGELNAFADLIRTRTKLTVCAFP